VIFGNSSSGKSTRAKKICCIEGQPHLDLDTLAWMPVTPLERRLLVESEAEISNFIRSNTGWVIEGCYSDLLEMVVSSSSELITLN